VKSYILKKNFTIQRAIKLLNIQEIKCLVITDKNKKLIGTIMDGDLRRAIVKNKNALDENIEKVINKKPFIFKKKNIHDIKNFIKSKKIDKTIQLIPVVDKNLKLIKIINLDEFIKKNLMLITRKNLN
jgi:predicted transcriptional regulator